jgi:glutathione S-transferase/RNA polymerase-associated protein
MKAKMALLEKGLEFQAILPEGLANGTATGAFVAASPRAEIPALIDGDVQVFDSTIILEYLEDKWPRPRCCPRLPRSGARAHDRGRHGRVVRAEQLGRHGGDALQARERRAR